MSKRPVRFPRPVKSESRHFNGKPKTWTLFGCSEPQIGRSIYWPGILLFGKGRDFF
jgi:hypothetical protein